MNGGELSSVTDEIEYGSSDNGSSNSQKDYDFQGAPLFSNNDIGVAAYPKKDKNGNWYLAVNLPLGLGPIHLFVNNGSYDNLDESFNKLVDHYNGK